MTIEDLKNLEFTTDSYAVTKVEACIPFFKTAIRKGWSVELNDKRGNDNLRLSLDVKEKKVNFQIGYKWFDNKELDHQSSILKTMVTEFCKTNNFAKFKLQFLRQQARGWAGNTKHKKVW